MKLLALLVPVLLAGCPDTHVNLSPPPAASPATDAPWAAPILVYQETGHPITWPYATDYAAIEDAWLIALNDERATHGVPALELDSLAVEGARAHAFHMNLHAFLSTVNPEGDGPVERYLRMGAQFRTVRQAVLAMEAIDVSLLGELLFATDVNHVGIGAWRAPQAGVYLVALDFTWR